MSATWDRIIQLVAVGRARVSEHGYDELAADGLFAADILRGAPDAVLLEDYPDYPKGPCVLVLVATPHGPVHCVWGIPKGKEEPAVLVTAYRPDPLKWQDGFTRRKR